MIIKRELFSKIEPYLDSEEAIIITGMRRVGKTTFLKSIYEKINSENKLFLDLENPINQKYFEEEDFEKIKFTLETLGLDFTKKPYLFLDEIQLLKGITHVVKYLYDHYKIKFFLTGSASFYIKDLFSESLSGRKYIFEMFPLSFKEFLELKEARVKIPEEHSRITKPIFDTISRYYTEYLEYGGFPQVVLKNSIEEKKQALNDIFTSYFQLEVKQFSDFKKTDKIRDLIFLLGERAGSKLDIKKLSLELSITRASVYDYMAFLEGTYFVKLIRPYSKSRDVEIRKTPKIYFCDSGILNNLASVSKGTVFEQNIFQELRNKGELNYYQKKTGAEIDFILDKKEAREVKVNPHNFDILKLKSMSEKLNIYDYKIISLDYSELENIIYGFEI